MLLRSIFYHSVPTSFCGVSTQGVSIVFATEEYRELLEPAAEKCDARVYLLPSVAGTCNDKSRGFLPIEQMEAQVQKVSSSIRGISK